MKVYFDCYSCFLKQALKLARQADCSEQQIKKMMNELLIALTKIDSELPPPLIAEQIEKIIFKYTKNKNPYKEIKQHSNDEALKLYPRFQKILMSAPDRFKTALKISGFGNLIDFALVDKINLQAELKIFHKLSINFKKYKEFIRKIKTAQTLLIIGDNAGEIVFDKLLIEYIKTAYPELKIFFAVRDNHTLNDATLFDAKYIGLDKVCTVISTGMAAPGVVLNRCSAKFRKLFESADIIISKGQGNYETLSDLKHPSLFFLLKIKCAVVSKHLNTKLGTLILT